MCELSTCRADKKVTILAQITSISPLSLSLPHLSQDAPRTSPPCFLQGSSESKPLPATSSHIQPPFSVQPGRNILGMAPLLPYFDVLYIPVQQHTALLKSTSAHLVTIFLHISPVHSPRKIYLQTSSRFPCSIFTLLLPSPATGPW